MTVLNSLRIPLSAAALVAIFAAAVAPAAAQTGPEPFGRDRFDRGGLGGPYDSDRGNSRARRATDSREGRVDAAQFAADDAADRLGRGEIRIAILADSTPGPRSRLDYEAAMLDRLGAAGYDISGNGNDAAQVARLRVTRDVVEPAEQKRGPVSGSTTVGVSNRGTAMGMALNLDFTEPRKALMATRMELRIVDTATDEVLWEARAEIATRAEDEDWTDPAIAYRLAAALLEGFPDREG